MRYKRILIVKPKYKGSYYGALHPPVGLGYIAQSLAKNNLEYDVLDMSLKYGMKDLLKKIKSFQPDLLGVSMMSFMYNDTYELIRQAKKAFPDVDVLLVSGHPDEIRKCQMDFILAGGKDVFLRKPLLDEELVDTVKSILSERF